MINVLVTGSKGQLASCIKDLENQYENINFIYTDYQGLDVCNRNQLKTFFETQRNINYCINCAAYTAVDKAETEAEKAFEINAIGAKNLALVCNEFDTTLIHVSTDFVFDGEKTEPYIETDAAKPISVYGASKLQGELEIQKAIEKYFILRTSWLYSEHGNNFMKTMLRLAETRDEISVISDQIGTPTYAGDLAEVILEIINTKSTCFGVYHYSNEGAISWYNFAAAIFEITKTQIKLNPIKTSAYPTPAKRPAFSVMDKTKIKRVLKNETSNWKESLKKQLLIYKK
jgi:dTDP-4-dehydrorhamnose reductase|tara:strand:- start:23371 stop:24231 length:861 start_codon:yes stop_codon:yes gene_type:complete